MPPPSSCLAVKHGPSLLTLEKGSGLSNQVPEKASSHKTNDLVWSKISLYLGPQEPLLAPVKSLKLAWFRHVTCHDSLAKTILQGTLKGVRP